MGKDMASPPALPAERRFGRNTALGVGVLCVVLAVVTVWTVPRPTGDLYVALAAGRDIVHGKLGSLDDWCFTTQGRVWVNQNWGTHMLYYLFFEAFGGEGRDRPDADAGALGGPGSNDVDPGETGLLVLKLLILLTGSAFLAFACRRRGGGWAVSLIVTAGIIAAGRSFIDLRPNLTTLMFVPVMLHLLFWSGDKPRRSWVVMIVFGLIWANLHGGFFLGLVTMAFWSACLIFPEMFKEKLLRSFLLRLLWVVGLALLAWLMCGAAGLPRRDTALVVGLVAVAGAAVVGVLVLCKWARQEKVKLTGALWELLAQIGRSIGPRWQYLAATAGAWVLAGVATPFGIHNLWRDYAQLKMSFSEIWNLTHPFVVMASQDSDLWQSVIEWHSIFTASPRTFGTTWEFFGIVGLFAVLVPMHVITKLTRKEKVNLEDVVLLAAIVVLAVAVFVQAKPVWREFGRFTDALQRNPNAMFLSETQLQRTGWLTALIVYPILGLFAFGAGVWVLADVLVRKSGLDRFDARRIGLLIFEVAMAAGGVHLAFGARRFIPLSLILLAPLLVRRVHWLLTELGRALPTIAAAVPTIAAGVGLFALIGLQTYSNALRYWPGSPLVRYRSMLKNMIVYEQFPPGARHFLNDNDLNGRAFNEWRWEGYLRWYCPQIQTFLGGRAQQVHHIDNYKLQRNVLNGTESPDLLWKMNVRWVVVPWNSGYNLLLSKTIETNMARWVPVYFDGENTVLANATLPECAQVINACLEGKLKYRDPAIGALSQARALDCHVIRSRIADAPKRALAALRIAERVRPIAGAYGLTDDLYQRTAVNSRDEVSYFEGEFKRLGQIDWRQRGGAEVLRCRQMTAILLIKLYQAMENQARQQKNPAAAKAFAAKYAWAVDQARQLNEVMGDVAAEWR